MPAYQLGGRISRRRQIAHYPVNVNYRDVSRIYATVVPRDFRYLNLRNRSVMNKVSRMLNTTNQALKKILSVNFPDFVVRNVDVLIRYENHHHAARNVVCPRCGFISLGEKRTKRRLEDKARRNN